MDTRYRSMTNAELGATLARLWTAKDAPRCANRARVRQWWAACFIEFRARQLEVA